MAKLKPIRLVIDKPLTGPYDRLLRRPGPEVENLGSGAYTGIIRGTRLTEALPLWEAEAVVFTERVICVAASHLRISSKSKKR
jgi:hypothetical protein